MMKTYFSSVDKILRVTYIQYYEEKTKQGKKQQLRN